MDNASISLVNKGQNSKETGILIFMAALVNLVEFFGGEWSELQIRETVKIFYDECYWFTFPELKHFTRKAKAMKLGKGEMFGKFTTATFMQWMSEYWADAMYERGKFYGVSSGRAEWVEPENRKYTEEEKQKYGYEGGVRIVQPEDLKELVKELEHDLLIQKADEEIESQKKRADAIDKYNGMLKKQAEFLKAAGGKTTMQVPDQNNIPGLND